MASITPVLRVDLAETFFATVNTIRAVGYHQKPGFPDAYYEGENLLPFSMTIAPSPGQNAVVASLNNSADYILIELPDQVGSIFITKLQFLDNSGNTIYLEYTFDTEIQYDGNGELHIDSINFKFE